MVTRAADLEKQRLTAVFFFQQPGREMSPTVDSTGSIQRDKFRFPSRSLCLHCLLRRCKAAVGHVAHSLCGSSQRETRRAEPLCNEERAQAAGFVREARKMPVVERCVIADGCSVCGRFQSFPAVPTVG